MTYNTVISSNPLIKKFRKKPLPTHQHTPVTTPKNQKIKKSKKFSSVRLHEYDNLCQFIPANIEDLAVDVNPDTYTVSFNAYVTRILPLPFEMSCLFPRHFSFT